VLPDDRNFGAVSTIWQKKYLLSKEIETAYISSDDWWGKVLKLTSIFDRKVHNLGNTGICSAQVPGIIWLENPAGVWQQCLGTCGRHRIHPSLNQD
jgi:hypothetical protein